MMKKIFGGAILAVLLTCNMAFAQLSRLVVPSQRLEVPNTITAQGVLLPSVSPIISRPKYFVGETYNWKILENGKVRTSNIKEWPDHTSVMIPTSDVPGTRYIIICAITYQYIVREKDAEDGKILEVANRTTILTAEVLTQGNRPNPNPGPDPNPNPNPEPDPTFPESKYGLSKRAYDWAKAKVDVNNRKGAVALAKSFEGIASAINANTISNIEDILKQTHTANDSALNSSNIPPSAWSGWASELQDYIYNLYHNRQMATAADFAVAWNEIAAGLKKVR
jgi:hypothetical protein